MKSPVPSQIPKRPFLCRVAPKARWLLLVGLLFAGSVMAQRKNQEPTAAPPGGINITMSVFPGSVPSYVAPASVIISIESFGTNEIVKTDLYQNGALVLSVPDAFLDTTLDNLPAGSYTFNGVATDELGGIRSKVQTITITAPTNQAPTVSLTAPANGQTFTTGNAVTLSATASDSDGSVAQVEFYVDGSLIGQDTSSPYSLGWASAAGSHSVYARALDNAGAATNSGTVNITVNNPPANVAPSVSLTAPTNGQTYTTGNLVTLAAAASDSDGSVVRVEFYLDGVKIGEDTSSPYSLSWTGTVGSHSVYARAVDNAGATTNSGAVSITVNNPPANVAPSVSLTSPSNGQTFTTGNMVTLSANASDSDGSVSRVEFYVDGSMVSQDTSAPYSLGWTSTAGNHSIYARAVDNAGAATNSATASITVSTSNVAPSVSLTSPTNGQTFITGNIVTLSASASDSDGTVSRVEFYVNGSKVSQDTTSPYSLGWTSTAGSHSIYARAVDNAGATTNSATVSITVNNPTPPPTSETPTPTPLPAAPGSFTKTETIAYYDDTSKWVLGQIASITDVTTGLVQTSNTYSPTTALPLTTSSYNKPQSTMTYYADGTLATVKDGRNNTTTLSNWKRGIPQTILYEDGSSQSAVVDDNGWITSVTDENGYITCYGSDAMGRLTKIEYPNESSGACDTSETNWKKLIRSFVPVASTEYGIAAGHWRETVTTGNAVKITYYDGMWRPLLVREYDASSQTATRRFTKTAYDAEGRVSFVSYPLGNVTYAAQQASDKGVTTFYDALGRVTSVSQDSELGLLTTMTEYLSGFLTRVTNPRGFETISTYLTYDQPSTDWPLVINAPNGASTSITRDVFGKPLSLVRSGGGAGAIRSYSYNAHQELCRSVEPETGATLFTYDAAGNLASSAAGLTAATACDTANTRTVSRTYDARNRLKTLSFPDSNGNQTWHYFNDGLPSSVSTSNGGNTVTNAYTYNKRRLMTGESMVPDTTQTGWGVGYGYNGLGQVVSEAYPDGVTVNYVANALGQTSQVNVGVLATSSNKVVASNVSYFPNGALKQFTYGNGIVHTMTQNVRQLPSRSTDGTVLDLATTFDENGNVSAVTDYTATGRQTMSMAYDGLDRLIGTSSPMFGAAIYTYDAIDNLTQVLVSGGAQARSHYYCYNGMTNRLDFVRTGSNCVSSPATIALSYDVQGNLSDKNTATYSFDYGNRLRIAAGLTYRYDADGRRVRQDAAGASLKYSYYTKDGRLVWQRDEPANKRISNVYLAGSLIVELNRPVSGTTETLSYFHTDALGSPIAKTNSAGTVIETSEYEPYGKLLNRPNNDRAGYTGHVMDSASGLTYMQQRYYDPAIGRFLSVDPVTAYSNPIGAFNRYWYANNNPYKFTDPDGRQAKQGGQRPSCETIECHRARQNERRDKSDSPFTGGTQAPRSQGAKDAIAAAGAGNTGAGTAATIGAGTVRAATFGELTPEAASAIKLTQKVAKGSALVGGALALDEIASGETTADKAHGWTNLAASIAGFGCAASGACGAVVGGGLLIYGIADTAVQLKQYKDPATGETYTGWQAVYRDMTD